MSILCEQWPQRRPYVLQHPALKAGDGVQPVGLEVLLFRLNPVEEGRDKWCACALRGMDIGARNGLSVLDAIIGR